MVINPAVGCGPSYEEEPFEFGESEMVTAVQGTWRLTFSRPEGASVVTFSLEKGPTPLPPNGAFAPGVAPQCGSRTFTRPAAACSPMSTLNVAAKVIEAEPALEAGEGSGYFRVSGAKFNGGELGINIGHLAISTILSATGTPTRTTLFSQGVFLEAVLARAEM